MIPVLRRQLLTCRSAWAIFGVIILSACQVELIDPEVLEAAALAPGDWGWDKGQGCENDADIVRLTDETISYIKNGSPLFEGRMHDRTINMDSSSGEGVNNIESSDWLYSFPDPETGERIVRQDRMHIRYTSLGFRGLQLTYRDEKRGDGDWDRVDPNDAERWDWLVPCEGAEESG